MKRNGFIKIWRKVMDSDIWKMSPLYLRTFVYLILNANWTLSLMPTPKGGIYVSPGMLLTSLQNIADDVAYYEYGVKRTPNRKTIKEILNWLFSNGMIELVSNAYGTTIFITNWHTYQSNEDLKVTEHVEEEVTTSGRQSKRQLDSYEEYIESNEENIKNNSAASTEIGQCLLRLKDVPGYPYNENKDQEFLLQKIREFPTINPVSLLKNWQVYILDHPFKKKSSPRSQLSNQFNNAQKYRKHLREKQNAYHDPIENLKKQMGVQDV